MKKISFALLFVAVFAAFAITASAADVRLPDYNAELLPEDLTAAFDTDGDTIAEEFDVEFGMKFSAVEANANASPVRNYTADFVITFDKDLPADSLVLVGHYDAYTQKTGTEWVPVAFTEDIKANQPIRIMDELMDSYVTYNDVLNFVREFDCGIIKDPASEVDFSGIKVKLELRLYEAGGKLTGGRYEETGKSYLVGNSYEFTFDTDLTWIATSDSGYYMDENDGILGLMRFLFHAKTNENVTDAGIKYINENLEGGGKVVDGSEIAATFFGDVDRIPEGTAGTYYAMAYVVIDGETYWSSPVECSPNFDKEISK